MTIFFYFETGVKLGQRRLLKQFIREMVIEEKAEILTLNFIFCSDSFLLNINKKFLKHNYYTDIITFDLKKEPDDYTQGEIYISVDRIRDNSLKYSTTEFEELHRVLFHGVLHLCGYRDKTRIEKTQMKRKEDYYLKKYNKYVPRETV